MILYSALMKAKLPIYKSLHSFLTYSKYSLPVDLFWKSWAVRLLFLYFYGQVFVGIVRDLDAASWTGIHLSS